MCHCQTFYLALFDSQSSSNLRIGLFIPLKRWSFQFIMISSIPLTSVRFLFSHCWTSRVLVTADHDILLSELSKRFCVDGMVLSWFKSHLSGRTQVFVHNGGQTAEFAVNCSVQKAQSSDQVVSRPTLKTSLMCWTAGTSSNHISTLTTRSSVTAVNIDSLRSRSSNCAPDIDRWWRSRWLQLDADKTKAVWFGSHVSLTTLGNSDHSMTVGSSTFQHSAVIHDLGVYLDSELSMKRIAKVAAVCFHHLGHLRQICRRVGMEANSGALDVKNRLLQLTVIWQLTTIRPLQRVQSAAAQTVVNLVWQNINCTGYQCAGTSSTNYAVLCTLFLLANALRTCAMSRSPSAPITYGLDCTRSSANVLLHTPVLQHGTNCRSISVGTLTA